MFNVNKKSRRTSDRHLSESISIGNSRNYSLHANIGLLRFTNFLFLNPQQTVNFKFKSFLSYITKGNSHKQIDLMEVMKCHHRKNK